MSGVSGIDAVFLRAERPDELARWYAQHLGVDPEPRDGPAFRTLPADFGHTGESWSVSFAVPDLAGMLDRLRTEGIDVDQPRQDSGGRYATLRDLEGNRVRLCERESAEESAQPPHVVAVDDEPFGGSASDAAPSARRRIATWAPLALVVILAAVFVVVIDPGGDAGEQAAPTSTPTRSEATPSSPVPDDVAAVRTTVRSIELGHPILGIQGDWELVAQGLDEVVRIEPARGRVTRIGIPSINDTRRLSMVVWPERVLLHAPAEARTFLVRDDGTAEKLPAPEHQSPIYPGAAPGQVWRAQGKGASAYYVLHTLDSEESDLVPNWGGAVLGPDLRGHLLVELAGDVYRGEFGKVRKVTTGELIATGPSKFLALECDEGGRCASVVIDRDSGQRRVLQTGVDRSAGLVGRISPDGSTAAVLTRDGSRTTLRLIDLESGLVRLLPDIARPGGFGTDLAWSPDGTWLFVAAGDGALRAVNVERAPEEVLQIRTALPAVSDLAIRPAPSP